MDTTKLKVESNNSVFENLIQVVRRVIGEEADALKEIAVNVDQSYAKAIEIIANSSGKVIVTGMGKSGHVGRKIAATMSSTGTLAVFMHPAEAAHGDLGVINRGDVVIAIGKSGESEEILSILPVIKKIGAAIISITANKNSTLARYSDVTLHAGNFKEACPHDLAPTTSTTVALAIGDALAIALLEYKNFQPKDFALFHPGGKLGKRLLLQVSDLMIPLSRCPVLDPSTATMEDIINSLTKYGLGVVLFSFDGGQTLEGVVTDGDIRRALGSYKSNFFDLSIGEIVKINPTTVSGSLLAIEALQAMEKREKPLNFLPVVNNGSCVGIIRLHELLQVA